MSAHILKIDEEDYNNGPGVRVVVWFSGCTHNCRECHNKATAEFGRGEVLDDFLIDHIISLLRGEDISGLTLSGGDPLHPDNTPDALRLVKKVAEALPEKNIWVWTGYKMSQLPDEVKNSDIDVIVDGKFNITLKEDLKYRGSSNQIIWLQKKGAKVWKDVTDKIDPSKNLIAIV